MNTKNTPKQETVLKRRIRADKLDLREITRSAPESTTNELIAKEGVHPFTSSNKAEELKTKRLAPGSSGATLWDKHCFGLFERGKNIPEFAVYVKLLYIAPDADGNIPSNKLPGNIGDILVSDVGQVENPNVAIFYTITNTALGADGKPDPNHEVVVLRSEAGRTGGNELIVKVAEHLSQPPYNIKAFSTLSPVRSGKGEKARGFRQWLKKELSESDKKQTILTAEEEKTIRSISGMAANDSLYEGLKRVIANRANISPQDQQSMERLMTDLGTYYVTHERKELSGKTAEKHGFAAKFMKLVPGRKGAQAAPKVSTPLDGVTGFHINNGAELANVHWVWPEHSTESDIKGAFGLMVNYRYYPELLDQRKGNFRREDVIRLSPALAERYYVRLEQLGKQPTPMDKHTANGSAVVPTSLCRDDIETGSWLSRVTDFAHSPRTATPSR